MDRRHFLSGCACCGLLGAFPAIAGAEWLTPPRLGRPEQSSEEGGLWAMLDREEAKLRRSRFLVRDKTLNDYVHGIVCKLAGNHCPDVRVYIVRSPYFNASMAPNGMMQVWTGLLLRMANEAQLAAVLGHEIGHYLSRHTLDRLRDAKSRSAFGQFLGIALSAAGAGGAAPLAQLALTAGMFAYERDHEREADRIGLELMAQAGYEPMEASRVWAQLLEELKAEQDWSGDAGQRSVLFASHPPAAERQQELESRAAALRSDNMMAGETKYKETLAQHRWEMLEDELRRRKFGESLALMQRMLKDMPHDGELRYFLGETYRMRGTDSDMQLALDAYKAAASEANAPAETFRAMGMVHRQTGEADAARQAFKRYLAAKPAAADAEMIQTYIKEGS